ncbi:MAG: hypothetical protein MK085_13910, partial [Phycisphaerales bacterium]|nr:hypothetical protein [Phycisphaerales bacterium]
MNSRQSGSSHAPSRRGSALVLVAGVLVLLVIIAAAYINSSHGIRKTVVAQRQTANTDAAAQLVASDIAREISDALFVREIDTNTSGSSGAQGNLQDLLWSGGGGVANGFSNRFLEDRRLPLVNSNYMSNMGRLPGRYEVDRNFAWNYAPWEVVPRTNWPDVGGGGHGFWHGINETDLTNNDGSQTEGIPGIVNPPGQPGTSDTRWLRDLEPFRTSTTYLNDVSTSNDVSNYSRRGANLDTFSHYGHLSNLARPGNDWRICRDIADVTGVWSQQHRALEDGEITGLPPLGTTAPDGYNYFGGLLRDHHVPVEQWLPYAPTSFFQSGSLLRNLRSGTSMFPPGGGQEFWASWVRWFDYEGNAYAQQMAALGNTSYVPQNFYDLSNLDGDDAFTGEGGGELQERPDDEFQKGTARWHVGRILTDTDGDGFTDSFWFHVPGSGTEGTMQVVGVSITDNSGRLNANVATQFTRADDHDLEFSRTRGWSPADLALVGQASIWESGEANGGWINTDNDYPWLPDTHESWNVGILDNPLNSAGLFGVEYDTGIPSVNIGSDEELVTYGSLGYDAVDLAPVYQQSEAYPIYNPYYFRYSTMGDMISELGIQFN